MRSDHRLVEREAENKFEEKKSYETNEKEMITEFRIVHKLAESEIEYKNLDGDWDTICKLHVLKDIDVVDYMTDDKDLILSDTVQNELEKLQKKFQNIFDYDLNMYEMSYRVNDDNSAELYLPLQTDFTEDFVIKEIYNKDGEFVAHDIENNIDFPLYELESKKFYIKKIPHSRKTINIYTKDESSYNDIIKSSYYSSDRSKNDFVKSSIVAIMMYVFIAILYLISGLELATVTFFMLNLLLFAPVSLPLFSILYVYIKLRTYIKYKNSDEFTSKKAFESEI